MKKFLLFVALQIITLAAISQNEYFTTDSISNAGVLNLIDGGARVNAKYCQRWVNDTLMRYGPDEVKAYRLNDGKEYFSREINTGDSVQRVFLERINPNQPTLYFYNGAQGRIFFIEDADSNLVRLERPTFRDELVPFAESCEYGSKFVKLVRFSKNGLTAFARKVNDCDPQPLHFRRFGLTFGYGRVDLGNTYSIIPYLAEVMQPDPQDAFSFGIFMDLPLLLGDFSFHADVNYTSINFSYNRHSNKTDLDIIANITTIKAPLMLRYTLPHKSWRPFVNTGYMLVYNKQVDIDFYQSSISPGTVLIGEPFLASFTNTQTGFSVGAGLDVDLTYRNTLSLELRYDRNIKNPHINSLDMQTLSLITAINF